ncbi:hypothetical protein [Paenibacillus polymyxa]|uniref:Uncharacterized protein n=1 Tax=Paenibacillus polymyxa (strain SC2) TaxID=886882 RepID=E3EL24_PAEPS|nr:hypothetical protein [Paenibacillus polymyxa]ADO59586.1 hypothetical protein PPSC2_27180 [Paenibacillus polymyxa SC2]WPQ59584.1 hypothetical protein SKN87_28380 [Paenibacillus polymyxa]
MTDKHYVDKNSIRKWIISEKTEFKDGESNYARGRADGLELLLRLLDGGKFDPDPPQQPDIQPGDRVVSVSKPGLGIGVVVDLKKENLQKFTDRTWVRFGNDDFALHTRTSDLELVQSERVDASSHNRTI